ncbi:YbhB/YbcL family Raf kinase inhibitor-like protein [Halosimplex salinum]|uniref:YbhB/YbcL family Raf kinase inhibitor-like protein n=1 Tax=Halosimplex salinum TaxID=1710538 RepID=UPI000F4888F7|nr:YbhB/YbcL family Raf kinase inhibitor-like protein [Halosimplex salinum]
MTSRRKFLVATGAALLAGCGSDSDGLTITRDDPTDDDGTDVPAQTDPLVVSSDAFDDGETIPERHTGVGEDVSPPLTVESAPAAAETYALVMDDPDADDYLHWLIWNVPAETTEIPEEIPRTESVDSLDGARQGTNDFGEIGYRGPLPPTDDGPHTYRFSAYAVDTTLDLEAGAGRGPLESALDGHVLNGYAFTGRFER